MSSITILSCPTTPVEQDRTIAPETVTTFDAAAEVARARELLAWVRSHNRVAHLLRLARMQREVRS